LELDLYNAIGYFGAFLYLLSYALLNLRKMDGNGFTYIFMNMIAAIFMVVSLMEYWNAPSFLIQSCWILFSVVGLLNLARKKKKSL
jgi:hypothetical protein